jgi:hypothetical protein
MISRVMNELRIPLPLLAAMLLFGPPWALAQNLSELIELARRTPGSIEFRTALLKTFAEGDLKAGRAIAGYGADFLWTIESATRPTFCLLMTPLAPPCRQSPGPTYGSGWAQ